MCVITFTSILQKKTQLFCFPSTNKSSRTQSEAFCIFKVKCVWIHAANQFPPDGDKWLAGQKESQEAAPSITTMNYSPSLSLNFQRRMIRQRRANPQQKRSICKVWISNVTAATRFRLSYKAVSIIIRFEENKDESEVKWYHQKNIQFSDNVMFFQCHHDLTWERSDMSRSTPILPRVRLKNRLSRLWWLEREEKWSRNKTDNRQIKQQICQV